MWKLTIIQKKKFTTGEGTYDVEVEFISNNLDSFFAAIDLIGDCGSERETSFLIEKVKGE